MNTSEVALNRALDRVEAWLTHWLDRLDAADARDW
jgi:hypothetical protein